MPANTQLNNLKEEVKPEEQKRDAMQEVINFQNTSPTPKKPDDELSQFIFENISMD